MIGVVPRGGFTYFLGEGIPPLEGSGRESLISKLTNYRVVNNIPIGDPEFDVDQQLGSRSSTYSPPRNAPLVPRPPETLLERVRDWLGNRYSTLNRLKFVSSDEANRRALICRACPRNVEWRSSCQPCVSEVERNVVIVSGNRQTRVSKLKACQVAGHENRVAVWLVPENLKHAHKFRNRFPKACWLREKALTNKD